MMNNTFNYSENKQLWTIENIAKENGFKLDLLREYMDKPLEERNEQTFYQFLKECTGKNGTLQKLEV